MDMSEPSGGIERRRGRRVNLNADVLIRRVDQPQAEPLSEAVTRDISLNGLYIETDQEPRLQANDVVVASVSVADAQQRDFPFSRVAGRARIIRVEPLPEDGSIPGKRFGIALEFGHDITALAATPDWG